MHVLSNASESHFPILCLYLHGPYTFTKHPLDNREDGFYFVALMVKMNVVCSFHLLSVSAMSFPYWNCFKFGRQELYYLAIDIP